MIRVELESGSVPGLGSGLGSGLGVGFAICFDTNSIRGWNLLGLVLGSGFDSESGLAAGLEWA